MSKIEEIVERIAEDRTFYSPKDIRRYGLAVAKAVVEECAKIADDGAAQARVTVDYAVGSHSEIATLTAKTTCEIVAKAIRALVAEPSKKE